MPEDVRTTQRQARLLQVAPQVGVESAARDAASASRVRPERFVRPHHGEILAPTLQPGASRLTRRPRQLALSRLAALAPIAVEDRRVLYGYAARRHAQHLGAATPREDKRQDDRPVPQADRRSGHDVQEPVDLLAAKSSCRAPGYLRAAALFEKAEWAFRCPVTPWHDTII